MANPLKVLVDLQARRNAAVSGSLEVTGSATFVSQAEAKNGLIVTGGELSASNALKAGAALTVGAGATVNGGNLAVTAGEISGSGELKAGAKLTVAGAADINGGNLVVSAGEISGSSALKAAGALTVGGAATVNGGNLAVTAGEISGSSALKAGGALTVAEGATVNGAAGLAVTAGDISGSADLLAGGDLVIAGAADINGGNLAVTAGDISGSAELKAAGKLTVGNGAAINGAGLTVATGGITVDAGGLEVKAGDSKVKNLAVDGNLFVKGSQNTVNVETLNMIVRDPIVHIGSGSEGGVFTDGDRGFVFDLAASKAGFWLDKETSKFILGENVSVIEVDGNVSLETNGYGELLAGNTQVSGTLDASGLIKGLASAEITGDVSASADLKAGAALTVGANATIHGSLTLDNSEAGFQTLTQYNASSSFTFAQVLKALDAALYGGSTSTKEHYVGMRYVETGSLAAGEVTVVLPQAGAYAGGFLAGDKIDNMVVDVMVRPDASSPWMNDLVSVYLSDNDGDAEVFISAPAAGAGWEYKLVVVNEDGSNL